MIAAEVQSHDRRTGAGGIFRNVPEHVKIECSAVIFQMHPDFTADGGIVESVCFLPAEFQPHFLRSGGYRSKHGINEHLTDLQPFFLPFSRSCDAFVVRSNQG